MDQYCATGGESRWDWVSLGWGDFNGNIKINGNFNGHCVAGAFPQPPIPSHPQKNLKPFPSITSQPPIPPRPKKNSSPTSTTVGSPGPTVGQSLLPPCLMNKNGLQLKEKLKEFIFSGECFV